MKNSVRIIVLTVIGIGTLISIGCSSSKHIYDALREKGYDTHKVENITQTKLRDDRGMHYWKMDDNIIPIKDFKIRDIWIVDVVDTTNGKKEKLIFNKNRTRIISK